MYGIGIAWEGPVRVVNRFFLDVGDTKCQSRHRIRSLFEVEPWIWNVRWRDACCILDLWESADDYLFSITQLQAELHAAQHLKY